MKHPTAIPAMRKTCLRCSGGSYDDVRDCPFTDCPLYEYRFGKRVYARFHIAYRLVPGHVRVEEMVVYHLGRHAALKIEHQRDAFYACEHTTDEGALVQVRVDQIEALATSEEGPP